MAPDLQNLALLSFQGTSEVGKLPVWYNSGLSSELYLSEFRLASAEVSSALHSIKGSRVQFLKVKLKHLHKRYC